MGSKRARIRMIHQEPDAWKLARPVLRGGKPVRVYLSRPPDVGISGISFSLPNMIDQSGLSETYDSMEDDFREITENVTHDSTTTFNVGILPYGNITGSILTFTLPEEEESGKPPIIEGMALWNEGSNRAIAGFNLLADMDNELNGNENELLLTSGEAEYYRRGGNLSQVRAQTFYFEPTRTQFIHLEVLSNQGSPGFVGIGEIAFAQRKANVPFEFGPLPGIIFIVAVGGMNYFRKRGWKKVTSDQ